MVLTNPTQWYEEYPTVSQSFHHYNHCVGCTHTRLRVERVALQSDCGDSCRRMSLNVSRDSSVNDHLRIRANGRTEVRPMAQAPCPITYTAKKKINSENYQSSSIILW